jgi:hypothetical protein
LLTVMHVVASDDESIPDGHAPHHVNPVVKEYLPAGHMVHSYMPAVDE